MSADNIINIPKKERNSIFSLSDAFIHSCRPLLPAIDTEEQEGSSTDSSSPTSTFRCAFCNIVFPTLKDQREHYKEDFHVYNIKRKKLKKPPVSEEAFLNLLQSEDCFENEEFLSNECIDEESEIDNANERGVHSFFVDSQHNLFAVYRNALCYTHESGEVKLRTAEDLKLVVVLLNRGGRFAGIVYKNGKITRHKTFHRYVIRAKSGVRQSVRDEVGGKPKSAGSSMRRYNEAGLIEDITGLIRSWKDDVDKADLIFLSAPGHINKIPFFTGSSPLFDKKDPRIVSIPISISRPTFEEAQNAFQLMSSISYGGQESFSLIKRLSRSPEQQVSVITPKQDSDAEKNSPNQEQQPNGSQQLANENPSATVADDSSAHSQTTAQSKKKKKGRVKGRNHVHNNVEMGSASEPLKRCESIEAKMLSKIQGFSLFSYCQKGQISKVEVFLDRFGQDILQERNAEGNTMLHIAALHNQTSLVELLLKIGADPCSCNKKNDVPFSLTTSKTTRNAFRRAFAVWPERHDWAKAKVPSPLTSSMEEERKQKERTKKNAQKKKQKEKKKEQEQKVMQELNDAIIAKEMQGNGFRCNNCECPVPSPIRIDEFVFCSETCGGTFF
eukprot:GCRY01004343.1.p1 GENE.GCRY01004343.1~~GCRY01004343.1.p1  ORF type:complete len:613 (+),score=74.34 GCRY01004343.1:76-1914(+)